MRGGRIPAVIAVVSAVAVTGCSQSPRSTASASITPTPHEVTTSARYPDTGPGAATVLAAGHWSKLPAAPIIGREYAATGWTGRQMLVWGGQTGPYRERLLGDGAAYTPATNRWSVLPASPLNARTGMASAWTGRELFVWGGYDRIGPKSASFRAASDGAVYSPAANTWRKLPPAPLSPRVYASAVWTGSEVVLIGGQPAVVGAQRTGRVEAAAWNQSTDTWRRLATIAEPSPRQVLAIYVVNAGGTLYTWVLWATYITRGNSATGTQGIDLEKYDPAVNRWHRMTTTGDVPAGFNQAPLWTGQEIINPAGRFDCGFASCPYSPARPGQRLTLATHSWSAIAAGPADNSASMSLWTGSSLLTLSAVMPAAWDANHNKWYRLPRPPFAADQYGVATVWTGTQLLQWGPMTPWSAVKREPRPYYAEGMSFTR